MAVIEGVGDEVTVAAAVVTLISIGVATFLYRSLCLEDFSSITWLYHQLIPGRQLPPARTPLSTPSTITRSESLTQPSATTVNSSSNINDSGALGSSGPVEPTPPITVAPETVLQRTSSQTSLETSPSTSTSNNYTSESTHSTATANANEAEIGQAATASEPNVESANSVPNLIRVRLKYLNDTERLVTAQVAETVGAFKRAYFAADLRANKTVRLIFNGQVLREDMTLRSYKIENRTVLHVHISQVQPQPNYSTSAHSDLDISSLMWPLFTVILGICWVMYIRYPEFFSVTSLILLIAFTASFLVVYVHSQVQVP